MALEHEALTERIMGAAIEVHRRLGPGFLESAELRQDNARTQASHCSLTLFLLSCIPHGDEWGLLPESATDSKNAS